MLQDKLKKNVARITGPLRVYDEWHPWKEAEKPRHAKITSQSVFLWNISQLANRLKETKFSFRPLATANICNLVLMRNHELFTGIEVKDKDGNVVGTSKIAARKVLTYGRKVKMAGYWQRSFLFVSVFKHTKRTRSIFSYLERTSLVNREDILRAFVGGAVASWLVRSFS